ncbi:hypothetical protein [Pseudothauera nasutitermitis]|uniref:hypothetical protein n=1 Tax=Pseudothauera nasutitermitis TaxID=2565930 RepID=UPI001454DBC6|nr:hypothetical protein [Pseudothauera nasutitermitis]
MEQFARLLEAVAVVLVAGPVPGFAGQAQRRLLELGLRLPRAEAVGLVGAPARKRMTKRQHLDDQLKIQRTCYFHKYWL